jgi:DNA-binding transcriptional LysR family regulator
MKLADLDLNLLRALDVLVRERNVTRAGRALRLTQPAMSNVLSRLRKTFDDPILVRSPGGMSPTPRALDLVEPVRSALATLEAAIAGAEAFDPASARGNFRIAVTDHSSFVVIPRLACALARQAPGVTLEAVHLRADTVVRDMLQGDIDLAITVGKIMQVTGSFHRRRLFSDRFVCLVRRGHPQVGKRLTLPRYVELSHVLVSPRGGRSGLVDVALAAQGLSRHVAVVVPHFLVAPFLVAQSNMVVTLSEHVARPFAEMLPLDVHEVPVALHTDDWSCVWHDRTHKDPAHVWLRDQLSEITRSDLRPSLSPPPRRPPGTRGRARR